jgi:hypothetical protein
MAVFPRVGLESGNATYQGQDDGMKSSTIGKKIENLHSASPAMDVGCRGFFCSAMRAKRLESR